MAIAKIFGNHIRVARDFLRGFRVPFAITIAHFAIVGFSRVGFPKCLIPRLGDT